jgi:hypothetical protein
VIPGAFVILCSTPLRSPSFFSRSQFSALFCSRIGGSIDPPPGLLLHSFFHAPCAQPVAISFFISLGPAEQLLTISNDARCRPSCYDLCHQFGPQYEHMGTLAILSDSGYHHLTRRTQIEQVTTDIPFIAVGITALAAVTCLLITQRLTLYVHKIGTSSYLLISPQSCVLYSSRCFFGF